MFACDVGAVIAHQMVFTNSSGGTVDPSEVILYLAPPTGAVGTYTYSGGNVTRLAQGSYSYNGTVTQAGYHNIRWLGTGAAVAAEQRRFFARSTNT